MDYYARIPVEKRRVTFYFIFYFIMNKFFYVLLIITVTLSASIASAEKAEIILSKTIDIPDRTVSFENQVFDITHIGNFRKGEDISFYVETESSGDILVILYNSEQLSTWFKRFSNTSGLSNTCVYIAPIYSPIIPIKKSIT